MHGLINRSIQSFLRDTYGAQLWQNVALDARLGFDNFEAMLSYDDALTEAVLTAAASRLARPRDTLLEDMGTYLVSHPHLEPLRRLLRFGGVTFVDFLHSLDDLPSRGRLAVPDLELPQLELVARSDHHFTLYCRGAGKGYGHVMVGVLRAMADDYGALVLLDYDGSDLAVETVTINLLEHRFAEGRRFSLASHAGSL
jgi:hypothetical protein